MARWCQPGIAKGICAMRSIAVALFVLGIPSATHCEAFTPASVIAGGGAARGGGCRGGRCGRVLGQKTGTEEGKGRAGVALRAHDDKVAFTKGKGAAGPLFDFPWKKGDPASQVCPDAHGAQLLMLRPSSALFGLQTGMHVSQA